MKIVPIEMSNFDLVYLHNGTPHCKTHGAMNKITLHEDGGGIWRCITLNGCVVNVQDGNARGKKEVDGLCRAACEERRTVNE